MFLASLSFSLVVEALQTLVHIDHQDPMHQPISVFVVGFVGLIVHGFCYLLLGGENIYLPFCSHAIIVFNVINRARNIFIPGPPAQNVGVSDEEGPNDPLNSSLLLKRKIQMKNCNLREICRDVVGRTTFVNYINTGKRRR